MKVYKIVESLAETSSRTEKENILASLGTDDKELFLKVARACYDGRISYYIKDIEFPLENIDETLSLDQAIDELMAKIANRTITGNEAREYVINLYSHMEHSDGLILMAIIDRNLRCGVSATTINKVFGTNTIYEHPYMQCSAFSEKTLKKISFPCISQTKMDAMYVDISTQLDGTVHVQTRSGQYLSLIDSDAINALSTHCKGFVLCGEAIYTDEDGNLLDRKTSNGILNSDEYDPSRIHFYIWDCIEYDCWGVGKEFVDESPYEERFEGVKNIVQKLRLLNFHVVDTRICHTADDVVSHFRDNRLKGEEGTVIKDLSGVWKSHKSPHQIKVKVIFDCDVKLTGYKEGTGKNACKIGAYLYESSDGVVKGSVGIGLSDDDRNVPFATIDKWVESGVIMALKGNDLVKDKNDETGTCSIFLPRFIEFRSDKTEADSSEHIMEQVKSFTDALQLIKG